MRILVATDNFPPTHGGVAVLLYNLCRQLAQRGHEVHVLVFGAQRQDSQVRGPDQQTGATAERSFWVHRWALPDRMSSVFIARHLLALLRRYTPDVIFFGHEACSEAPGMWLARNLFGTPSLMLVHGGVLRWRLHHLKGADGVFARFALREASLVLANSGFTQSELVREGVRVEKTGILRPGVDHCMFCPQVDTGAVVARHQLQRKRVILSVGRLITRKNFAAVMHALPAVLSRFPSLTYVIVGEGPEKESLEQLSMALGLSKVVVFAGSIDNDKLPAYYHASDLFIMPCLDLEGDSETFGMVYLEASACERPVIGGRTGGIGDAVIDGETGLLVDPRNTDEIAAAMIRLLADREYAQRLGRNGRLRVEREFSWERVGERLERYLQSVIRSS